MPPIRRMYQTVAYSPEERTEPHYAKNIQWLGKGYYFWYHEEHAQWLGRDMCSQGGKFNIYTADINTEKILDTVFNEEHYLFWLNTPDKF